MTPHYLPTLREVSELTGVSRRRLERWRSVGRIPPKGPDGWDVGAILRIIAAAEADAGEDGPEEADVPTSPALERLRAANASRAELQLARERGELFQSESVRAALQSMVLAFSSALRTLEVHALEDTGLEGDDLKTYEQRLGGRIDAAIEAVNSELANIRLEGAK